MRASVCPGEGEGAKEQQEVAALLAGGWLPAFYSHAELCFRFCLCGIWGRGAGTVNPKGLLPSERPASA